MHGRTFYIPWRQWKKYVQSSFISGFLAFGVQILQDFFCQQNIWSKQIGPNIFWVNKIFGVWNKNWLKIHLSTKFFDNFIIIFQKRRFMHRIWALCDQNFTPPSLDCRAVLQALRREKNQKLDQEFPYINQTSEKFSQFI